MAFSSFERRTVVPTGGVKEDLALDWRRELGVSVRSGGGESVDELFSGTTSASRDPAMVRRGLTWTAGFLLPLMGSKVIEMPFVCPLR